MGIGHLAMTGEPWNVVVDDRDVVGQEPVPAGGAQGSKRRERPRHRIALESAFGLDDTRTKPLSVIGQVAQPAEAFSTNQLRMAV